MSDTRNNQEIVGTAYLEYLRNLTPQVALLSLALVASIDPSAKSFKDLSASALVFVATCVLGALLAMYFNTLQFLRKALDPSDNFLTERAAFYREKGWYAVFSHLVALLDICFERSRLFILALFAILVASITPWVLLALSIFSATSIFRAIH